MKLLKEEFNLENLTTNINKTFSTIRLILKDDVLLSKVTSNEPGALAFLSLSMRGNALSLGDEQVSYFYNKLPDVFEWFSSFSTFINFLVSNSNETLFKEILEDLRISIQNFFYLLQFNNIYDSLVEYRKIIEGAL